MIHHYKEWGDEMFPGSHPLVSVAGKDLCSATGSGAGAVMGGLLGWGMVAAASVFPQRKSRFFSLMAWRTEPLCKGHCRDEAHGNDQGWLSPPSGGEDGCTTMQAVVVSSCCPWAGPPVPWDPSLCSRGRG